MNLKHFIDILKEFSNKLPKFPEGRINYSNSNTAPVITVFVKYQDKILLLKRSNKVSAYQGKWMTVAGYLDNVNQSLEEKAYEELEEEIGIKTDAIASVHIGQQFTYSDKEINKTWITHPVLIVLKNKPEIILDQEHTEFKWIRPEELTQYDIVPKLDQSWQNANKKAD